MEKSTSVENDNKSLTKDRTSSCSSICARRSNGMMIKDSSIDPYWSSWKNNNNSRDHQDSVGDLLGFSWPPRSYTCTFCKREFRSAQALGGHMNVHRRDRARLRQIMPSSSSSSNYTLLNLNLHPNPNPNPSYNLSPSFSSNLLAPMMSSSSPSSTQHNSPSTATHPSYRLCPRSGTTSLKSQIPSFRVCKFDGFPSDDKGKIGTYRSENIVRLNLEIGLLGESESDDLDLELRLGCA